MATPLQALLNIVANVKGEGAVAGLTKAIGGVKGAAEGTSKGLKGLTSSLGMGGVAGAMTALTPLLSAAGLATMAAGAINAGDAMWDMSQKTGVSVELLSKFKQAAEMNGTTIDAVGTGIIKLGKAMEMAAAATTSADLGGKTQAEIDQAVEATEAGGRRQVQAVEDGEKRQTAAIEREADRKMAAMDRETDRRLSALARRYRREEQLLGDWFDDYKAEVDNAAQDQTDQLLKNAQRRYEAQKKILEADKTLTDAAREQRLQSLQDAYDKETDLIRDNATKAQKARDRAARDEQQQRQDEMDEQRRREEEALKAKSEAEKQALKDQSAAKKDIIKKEADQTVEIIKASVAAAVKELKADTGKSALEQQFEDMGLSGKGASAAFKELGVSIKDATGQMRPTSEVMLDIADKFNQMPDGAKKSTLALRLFGKAGADLIPMLNGGRASIESLNASMSTGFAKAAGEYDDKLKNLATRMGELAAKIAGALLPVLDTLTNAAVWFLNWLNGLDPTMQNIIVTVGLVGTALLGVAVVLAPVVSAVVALVVALAGAGGLSAAMGVVLATVAGFITWPVLLIAGLVAAGVAIFAFRDQIGAFFGWWLKTSQETLGAIGRILYTLYLEPFVKVSAGIRDATMALLNWLPTGWRAFSTFATGIFTAIGKAFSTFFVEPVRRAFTIVVDAGRNALRGLLQWGANAINALIDRINWMINGLNRARAALRMGPIDGLSRVSVPAFAEGGFVTGPTMAMVGDNPGGREYIVPEGKAAGFAQNYLAGARGAAAIPSSTGTGGGGPVTVNLTTGPLQQLPDGRGGLPIEDVEKLVRQAVIGALRQARTPAGRYAMGG